MARRKLRPVPDLPPTPAEPKPAERDRFISESSHSVFKEGTRWLTISQLSRAFLGGRHARSLGLLVTDTDLNLLRFVFTCGAMSKGRHRWRVLGTPMTLVRSLSGRTFLDPAEIRRSLRRLQELQLLDVQEQEVWTTHKMHRIGAEILWCDLLWHSCPDGFDPRQLDWWTVTREVDSLFTKAKLDPMKAPDRYEVMRQVADEVQRRCTSD